MKTQHTLDGSIFTGLLVCGLLVGCGKKEATTATVTVNTAPVTNMLSIESPAVTVVTNTVSLTVNTAPVTNMLSIETPALTVVTDTVSVSAVTNADGTTGVIVK